jgi:hypothetical protein
MLKSRTSTLPMAVSPLPDGRGMEWLPYRDRQGAGRERALKTIY